MGNSSDKAEDYASFIADADRYENEKKFFDAAKILLKAAETLTQPNFDLIYRIALCLSRCKKYDKAIEQCNKLIQIDPSNVKGYAALGYQYYSLKDWAKAKDAFIKALKIFPNYFVVKYRLAYCYFQIAGIYQKTAKEEYWKCLSQLEECHVLWDLFSEQEKNKEKDTFYKVCFLHGKALMDIDRFKEKAISLFERALEIEADDNCRYELAYTYYSLNKIKEAKEVLPKPIKDFYTLELSARIDLKSDDTKSAIEKITKIVAVYKKRYARYLLAEAYIQNKQFDDAYIICHTLLQEESNNFKNQFLMAEFYYSIGLFNLSRERIDMARKKKMEIFNIPIYKECDRLSKQIDELITSDYSDDLSKIVHYENLIDPSKKGTIIKYNYQKGFGFIKTEQDNIFFHFSKCDFKDIKIGQKVKFSLGHNEKGQMAENITKC